MKTYSLSSWQLRIKKMMPTMMPMKMSEPRIPPMTAPVFGPGVNSLFSSGGKKEKNVNVRAYGHFQQLW